MALTGDVVHRLVAAAHELNSEGLPRARRVGVRVPVERALLARGERATRTRVSGRNVRTDDRGSRDGQHSGEVGLEHGDRGVGLFLVRKSWEQRGKCAYVMVYRLARVERQMRGLERAEGVLSE